MTADQEAPSRAREVILYFLRLGCIAFGGPAAHIAIMRRELIQQRKWLTDQEFVDHLGVTNLIPGPNSTELTMHMGARRAGFVGLWLAGAGFILPAALIVLAFAWAYVQWGGTPAGEALIYGVQPIVLAIIIQAAWGLRTAAFKGAATIAVAIIAAGLQVADLPYANEAVIVIGSGLLLLLWRNFSPGGRGDGEGGAVPPPRLRLPRLPFRRGANAIAPLFMATPAGYALPELFLVFLKIGAVLYGSGYVLIAFVEADLVVAREWLTARQLVDAIAVGQFTPGPVFTTATFIGYVIDGIPGALAATAGIFLPSFIFVALTHPLVPRLRNSPWAAPFLDGVNAAALALVLVVCARLAQDAIEDFYSAGLFVAGAAVLIRFSPNSAWLILAGASAGVLHALIT